MQSEIDRLAEPGQWTVLLHGGASEIVDADVLPEIETQMQRALHSCFAAIAAGKNGLEVVVSGLVVLEASEYFDAGYGAFPRAESDVVQLDVSLTDGSGAFYALAGVRQLIHPSRLALSLISDSTTSMFRWYTDELAEMVARAPAAQKEHFGWRSSEEEMVAPFARKVLTHLAQKKCSKGRGTVGCLVRSPDGALFAGTSTGGTPFAPFGRIGDTPVIGAGSFADNEIAALSATGKGEALLASSTAAFAAAGIAARQELGPVDFSTLQTLLFAQLQRTANRFPGVEAGLIAITRNGCPGAAFTSECMPCALGFGTSGVSKEFVSIYGLSRR